MRKIIVFSAFIFLLVGCGQAKPAPLNSNQPPAQDQATLEKTLAQILADRNNKSVNEAIVKINKLQNNFVAGSITFATIAGPKGIFLARENVGTWLIDYEGNGSIDCAKIRAFGYPEEVLTGFCDKACTQEAKLCPDGSAVGRTGSNCEFAPCPGAEQSNSKTLSEAEARQIAETTCIKGGEALGNGIHNVGTQTWWFEANLNATKPGCNPACVVSDVTKTAEINWRCTGLLPPTK